MDMLAGESQIVLPSAFELPIWVVLLAPVAMIVGVAAVLLWLRRRRQTPPPLPRP